MNCRGGHGCCGKPHWPGENRWWHGHRGRGNRRRHHQGRPDRPLRYDRGGRGRAAIQQDRHGKAEDPGRPLGRELPRLLRDSRAAGRRQNRQGQGRQAGDPVPREQRGQGAQDGGSRYPDSDLPKRGCCGGGACRFVIAMASLDARRLVLRNDLAELQRLAGWIQGWSDASVVSSDVSFAVQLCLEEAVANVIMYGSPKGDSLEIAIEVERDDGALVALIEDNGRQFDPTKVPPPARATSLEDAKIGEVGIHLMRSFATDMHYERRDGRNRLTLRFIEPQAGARAAR